MEAGTKRIYFEGLNEVRALAALFVMFHHIELFKARDEVASLLNSGYSIYIQSFIRNLGKNGVFIFFVLSGFLITYLLLAEKEKIGKIDIKKFYIRRVLRIWPLYYFIVFLSFVILPNLALNMDVFKTSPHYYNAILKLVDTEYAPLYLFLLFLPNLALKIHSGVVGASQAWSVGVEEQFYILWPQLVQRTAKKYYIFLFAGIAFIFPYFHIPIRFVSPEWASNFLWFLELFPINFMGVGALGAYFYYYHKDKLMPFLKSNTLFFLNTALVIFLLFYSSSKTIFALVVLTELLFLMQPHFRFNLRNKYLSRVGVLSYGVYMYHPLVMYLVFTFWYGVFGKDGLPSTGLFNILIYSSILIVTLVISHISYEYFEKRFIALKNKKYTVIKSGEKTD